MVKCEKQVCDVRACVAGINNLYQIFDNNV